MIFEENNASRIIMIIQHYVWNIFSYSVVKLVIKKDIQESDSETPYF